MLSLPNWLLTLFEKERFSCPACKADFVASGVGVAGIKQNDHGDEKLYIEYLCPSCSRRIGYEICNMNLQEFAETITNSENVEIHTKPNNVNAVFRGQEPDVKKTKRTKGRSKSKITPEEKKQMLKALEECDTYNEMLAKINAPVIDLIECEISKKTAKTFRMK